jgi:hypothetical protein
MSIKTEDGTVISLSATIDCSDPQPIVTMYHAQEEESLARSMIHGSVAASRLSACEARKFAQLLLEWADLCEHLAEKQAKEPYNDVITTASGGVFVRQGVRFTHYSPTEARYIGDLLIRTSDAARKGQLRLAECPEAHARDLGPWEVFATTTGVCLREGDSYESYSFDDAHELGELLIRTQRQSETDPGKPVN